MSTLAQLRDRVEQTLLDVTNIRFTADGIDEGIRSALSEYSQVNPLTMETVLTLPGDGREIALDAVDGFIEAVGVWWPFDSDATQETWPPNRVRGWRVNWDDARPVLFLDLLDGAQPQQGDELRLWYSKVHVIQNLDAGDASTLPAGHESLLVGGAAGHAAAGRYARLIETADMSGEKLDQLLRLSDHKLKEFHAALEGLRGTGARSGPAWGEGWKLDEWDTG